MPLKRCHSSVNLNTFNPTPSLLVDYLNHTFEVDSINAASKVIKAFNPIDDVQNSRLANVLWRSWLIKHSKLRKTDPRQLNWHKDADTGFLYGPIPSHPLDMDDKKRKKKTRSRTSSIPSEPSRRHKSRGKKLKTCLKQTPPTWPLQYLDSTNVSLMDMSLQERCSRALGLDWHKVQDILVAKQNGELPCIACIQQQGKTWDPTERKDSGKIMDEFESTHSCNSSPAQSIPQPEPQRAQEPMIVASTTPLSRLSTFLSSLSLRRNGRIEDNSPELGVRKVNFISTVERAIIVEDDAADFYDDMVEEDEDEEPMMISETESEYSADSDHFGFKRPRGAAFRVGIRAAGLDNDDSDDLDSEDEESISDAPYSGRTAKLGVGMGSLIESEQVAERVPLRRSASGSSLSNGAPPPQNIFSVPKDHLRNISRSRRRSRPVAQNYKPMMRRIESGELNHPVKGAGDVASEAVLQQVERERAQADIQSLQVRKNVYSSWPQDVEIQPNVRVDAQEIATPVKQYVERGAEIVQNLKEAVNDLWLGVSLGTSWF
jgi:hypothetical protein